MKHAYITCPSWLGANSPCSLRDEGYVRSTAATVGRAIGPMAVMTAGMKGCLDRFCMKCCPTNTIYPILRTIHMWRISIESICFFVYIYMPTLPNRIASYKDCCFRGGHSLCDLDPESFHDLSGVKPECWASETLICSILMTLSQTIIS